MPDVKSHNKPPTLYFRVGDYVMVRTDEGSYYTAEYGISKQVEMSGKVGVIISLNAMGNSTIRLQFATKKVDYYPSRLYDRNGNTFQLGWNYRAKKGDGKFKYNLIFEPYEKNENPDKSNIFEWSRG